MPKEGVDQTIIEASGWAILILVTIGLILAEYTDIGVLLRFVFGSPILFIFSIICAIISLETERLKWRVAAHYSAIFLFISGWVAFLIKYIHSVSLTRECTASPTAYPTLVASHSYHLLVA